ncbi:MAG: hypothetical protein GX221_06310 [Candidatus Riflebacteria bacterium]|nr:hypothetical protein [Candidatus Riflebacteria bacterium]
MSSSNEAIRLYNLFPNLFGSMLEWANQLDKVKDMGFNAVWVNPFHYPGFSGSLYSPKDYYRFNPLFIDNNSDLEPEEQLSFVIKKAHENGLKFIMDLVINHTAIDCDLVKDHPDWYKIDSSGKVVNPGAMHDGKWVAWGDLAEVNNQNSLDRDNLWNFWLNMMIHYLELGVDGFRCDMAYQVPSDLWRYLIGATKKINPDCLFLAESLGCDFKQVEELANLGFDYLFNSLKFWNFNDGWAIEQYYKTAPLAKTISFPESHDTDRLMETYGGNPDPVIRQMILSALYSSGYMITSGFEYGYRTRLNVVKTRPEDAEKSTGHDFTELLKYCASLKKKYPVLNIEEGMEIVDQANWMNVFCFKRSAPGEKTVLAIMNKDIYNHQNVYLPGLSTILNSSDYEDISFKEPFNALPHSLDYNLKPSEIRVFAAK